MQSPWLATALAVAAAWSCHGPEPVKAPPDTIAPAPGSARQSAAPKPNLLLITLDTTRADRIGVYGYRDARTPALDELAASGTLFEHAYSVCPLTLPSHATMFTGLLPPEHGLRINGERSLRESVSTLPKLLKDAGYRTGAFVAAFVLNHRYGLGGGDEGESVDCGWGRRRATSDSGGLSESRWHGCLPEGCAASRV